MSDNLARVLPFTPRPRRPVVQVRTRTVVRLHNRPPRRQPRNGHTPDCPYETRNPENCGICASERKGASR